MGKKAADYRSGKQATGIVAQIQNQPFQVAFVFLVQTIQCCSEILAGMFLKLGNADKGIARLDQLGFDALYLDNGTRQGKHKRFGFILAKHGQDDFAAGFAAHEFDRIVQ